MIKKITDSKLLCLRCDPSQLPFETTAELEELKEFLGQPRALSAIHFSVGIKQYGYNLYALGPPGVGKLSVVNSVLEEEASRRPIPADWCYVHNFENPQKPIVLSLPAGLGQKFRRAMQNLVEDLTALIPAAFESEEYRVRIQEVNEGFNREQEKILKGLEDEAKKDEMAIINTARGFVVSPANKQGEALSAEEFAKLPEKERAQKEALIAELTKQISEALRKIPLLQKKRLTKEKEIQKEFTMSVVGDLLEQLRKEYADYPVVINYLNAIENDVIENVKDFLKKEETVQTAFGVTTFKPSLIRYQVNLFVDNSQTKKAPIIYEDNPNYSNLIGSIEHVAQFGTFVTDFTLIRPGSLHRANGGFLIVDVFRVLTHPFAWAGLKRALYSRKVRIEPPQQMLGLTSLSLEPDPIPLEVKVVLLGDRQLYYLLCALDPDFLELFKVGSDFEEMVQRTPENVNLYARLIATLVKREQLRMFDKSAVATVIDESSRWLGDSEKLSLHMRSVSDLLREADYWASEAGHDIVVASDVQQAIDKQIFHRDRVRERVYESVFRNFVLIDTVGKKIGQVNALSVIALGDFAFGYPVKVTATIRYGKGDVIDIEREVDLSGSIHSKGILILSGFLFGRYAKNKPISLSASLVFEQNYHLIEGDSASVAELCALLTAIAEVPAKQSLAITGAVNQFGQVQAVGGVNEKIEGFFDICKEKGLNGKQGVLIPAHNAKNLMLKKEVIDAINDNQFHIYLMETVDDALALLTGMTPGERDKKGKFPEKSLNYLIEQRLLSFVKKAKQKKQSSARKKRRR